MRLAGRSSRLLPLVLLACGDEDPTVRSYEASRANALATSTPERGQADGASVDTGLPFDGGPDTADTADAGAMDATDSAADTTVPADTVADIPQDGGEGGPELSLPRTLAIPWVQTGAGGSRLALTVENISGFGKFSASLSGDARLHLEPYEDDVAELASLVLRFDGAAQRTVVKGRLTVIDALGTRQVEVWAMASEALPAASWTELRSADRLYGETATVHLLTAPFPDPSGSWSDDSVNLFVPEGYLDRANVPFVVHFHGHGTTLAETLAYHKYREQLWASGVNAVLVTPQGPVQAASGNFGKLMTSGGLEAMLGDVSAILYRDGLVATPLAGDLTLTEHSGGYQAVALNLATMTDEGQVLAAHLFDGLYAYSAVYDDFVRAGGRLRSTYTALGGTRQNNLDLAAALGPLATEDARAATLRDEPAAIWFTPAAHGDCTWWEQAYAEALRWGSTNARRGPRIELRTATVSAGSATVTWLAPEDDWTMAHLVETSSDGFAWTVAATVDPSIGRATFPLAQGRRVRVVPQVEDLDPALALPSDSYWLEDSRVLVVDGFDRLLGGSWTDLRHDASARVGKAAKAMSASNEAVVEGEVELSYYTAVIWLLGDESVADHTFTPVEQATVQAYLAGGGRLVVSGSEVAYDLGAKGNGASFLAGLGAVYQADDADQNTARGAGTLAALPSFGFGGAGAPYLEDYPDALLTATGGTLALQYGNGMTAAAGKANRSVVVGFPLEVIDDEQKLALVVTALLGFVGVAP